MSTGEGLAIGGVLETCLYAESLDETAAFYARVLGLERFAVVEGRHVFFRCGRGVFLLFDPRKTREESEVPPHGATGPGHVAFGVPAEELGAWRARLEEEGVEIEREVEWPRGGRSLYVRDPAGNCVELATPGMWSIPEDRFLQRGR